MPPSECECNHHSDSCHFDMAVYLSSGNRSGGVCEDCQHNTLGQWCEGCRPFYYRHPERDVQDPGSCEPCDCDPRGSLNNGLCDSTTDVLRDMISGQCHCKENVEGQRCDHCKKGHYALGNDPVGCKPCSCDPLGTLPGGNPCAPQTGSCFCKRLVTGWNCDQCLPEHWGLNNDMDGCRPCDCDVGGAINNNCSQETGQCVCKEHVFGRRCDQTVQVLQRALPQDHKATWSGTGFAEVPEGETLTFTIQGVPRSMEYKLMIRYEPLLPDVWERVVLKVEHPRGSHSSHCSSTYDDDDDHTTTLHPGSRYVVLPNPVCLERGQNYTVKMSFPQYSSYSFSSSPHVLIDSLVLLPDVQSLDLFSGGAQQKMNWEMFQKYRCMERSQSVIKIPLTDICRDYIFSVSAIMHNGALECQCDPRGSLSTVCDSIGGQCKCLPNVSGRNCDACASATYQLGPSGCKPCDCNPLGSQNLICHPSTGQCLCVPGALGRQCGSCEPNHWGFPDCKPCSCHGQSQECHPFTGQCLSCRGHTTGHSCERCEVGYHRSTQVGSREPCHPCMCPNGPGSGMQFAESCYQKPETTQMVCVCNLGYKGPKCAECASGYYGNPQVPGGRCHPCQCNNNINMQDPESCDGRTGACLKCQYHTGGKECQYCSRGYYGDARRQSCRRCMCHLVGTSRQSCADGLCECERVSGQCPCLPRVVGQICDRCSPNTWNINSGRGCEACACHPEHSYSSACDPLSGQCSCKSGFGGRTCEECRPLFWGDPEVQCQACDCDPQGSITQQCNKSSGQCLCKEGAAGPRCDSCGRGYVGSFPDCKACHQCFSEWDVNVDELTNQTQRLVDTVQEMEETGVLSSYKDIIMNLDYESNQLRGMLGDNTLQQALTHVKRMMLRAKYEQHTHTCTSLSLTEQERKKSLDRSEADLKKVAADRQQAMEGLRNLSTQTQNLHKISSHKQQQVLKTKHSDPRGAIDSIREYYRESTEAEHQATRAISEPFTESVQLWTEADDKLKRTEREFTLKHQLYLQRLEKIQADLDSTDLSRLSRQVCGGSAGLEGCSDCGGLRCQDQGGDFHCGGDLCQTIVSRSEENLKKARNLDQEVLQALGEVDQLNRMVSNARGISEVTKHSAQDVLLRANQTKEEMQQTNDEIRNLIQQIREFLSSTTDPKRIETVATRVIKIRLPEATGEMKNISSQIRKHVSKLSKVEDILRESAPKTHQAHTLQQVAQEARVQAVALEEATGEVKQVLDETKKIQKESTQKIKEAQKFRLSSNTVRFLDLERDFDELQLRSVETPRAAEETQRQAQDVTADIQHTRREIESLVQPKYELLSVLIDPKAAGVFGAHLRADQLREEANNLLTDANEKLVRLRELERSFAVNKQILADRSAELERLEVKARETLLQLRQKTSIYSSCA
ncbi:hypothetical protein DNTS_001759 [Danionella cerebrum]|uniref:Uncharacterized protein n=1 Tax=Danionella cerebrum TaxID=2873325 RepID=A0A553MNN2_9TELE|nr:hypothetical protein DNTS_001759 [Danionella translucida]